MIPQEIQQISSFYTNMQNLQKKQKKWQQIVISKKGKMYEIKWKYERNNYKI